MRNVTRYFASFVVILLFLPVQQISGQQQARGRMRVLVPTFAGEDRVSVRLGERVAETVRRHIDELPTHVSVDPRQVRTALREAGRNEADMDCVSWRQLARLIQADLVLCGRVTAAGQVTASFVSSENAATFDVPVFTSQNEQEVATRVVTAFNEFVEQITKAYYCAESIASEAWQQAVEYCTVAVERNPTMIGAQYHLASALIRLDRVEDALKAYERVIELDPTHQDALLGAGVAASRLRQYELSRRHLEEYLTFNPADEQVRISVASRIATDGEPLAALRLMEAALKRDDAGPLTYQYAGHFAMAAALRGPNDDQDHMTQLVNAGVAYYASAEQRGATPDLTALRTTTQALVRLRRAQEAVVVGERGTGLFRDDAGMWSVYADALRDVGRPRDALAALDRVMELAPDQPRIGARRALLLIELRRPDDALVAARQSIDGAEIDAAAIESIAQTFVAFVARMNPLQHDIALTYLNAARQLGKSERTIGMINHVHGFVLYRQAEDLAKPNTPASAAQALPVFRMALTLLQSASGYADQAENRRSMIDGAQRYIEIQEALIKRR